MILRRWWKSPGIPMQRVTTRSKTTLFLPCLFPATSIHLATSVDGCPSLGARYVSRSGVYSDSTSCSTLGGEVSGSYCNLDWCTGDRIHPDGNYIR